MNILFLAMTVSFWIIGCCLECLNDVICSWLIQDPIKDVFLWKNSPGAAWQIGVHPLILEGAFQPYRINAASISHSCLSSPQLQGWFNIRSPLISDGFVQGREWESQYRIKILKLHFFALLIIGTISSPPSPLSPTKSR